jgi:hypothetical protein
VVGACRAAPLILGRAWTWPVPAAARLSFGAVMLLAVLALAVAATSRHSYRRTRPTAAAILIHHQDIRRPLGRPRAIPAERLLPALRVALIAPAIGGFWRIRGVRLIGTDLHFSAGAGPEVHGAAEALLMTIAGRPGVVSELSGPGQRKLAGRIGV